MIDPNSDRSFGNLYVSRKNRNYELAPVSAPETKTSDGPVTRHTEVTRKGSALHRTNVTLYRDTPYADLEFVVDLAVLDETSARYAIACEFGNLFWTTLAIDLAHSITQPRLLWRSIPGLRQRSRDGKESQSGIVRADPSGIRVWDGNDQRGGRQVGSASTHGAASFDECRPPERRQWQRRCPKLDPVREFIDAILEQDRTAPRKQRHTARRIYVRIRQERPDCELSERTERGYVGKRKQELGWVSRETFVPQSYGWGSEAQVDWYEAVAELGGERQTVQVFAMRSMASGGAFHRAYPRATQQAFWKGMSGLLSILVGCFRRCRYDNLKSSVKKILQGYEREQTARFIAFRSHWKFEAVFCNPGQAHEKGGVEGEVGYFRRTIGCHCRGRETSRN